ncbi:protein CIP2A [Eurosta solidaginis]|uniref:protein CIP2A n=1 Tax=Eurosta solidaginis TaxID=178769 RepID=UPI0035310FD3
MAPPTKHANGSVAVGTLSTLGSDSGNDTATQLALSYVRDFCMHATNYRNQQTIESLALLNRSASLLGSTVQPHHFNPAQLETSKLFIDLHAVMGNLAADSDALWACVTLLQQISRNLTARRALVDDFRFVPLLAFVLKRSHGQEKIQKILTLLQDLTYGIQISWEEPYLIVLLEQLVNIIYQAADESEDALAQLSLSVLINLCYKNFVVMFLFLRSVNISNFTKRIQGYGMLASKMLIILSEDTHTPTQKDMDLFIRSTFATVEECIKSWNVPYLQHIVEFLLDSKAHTPLYRSMLSYTQYCEDVERLLNQLENGGIADDTDEITAKQQHTCLGLLFRLIRYILQLGTIPETDGKENVISLDSNVPRIFELLGKWLDSEICGVDAVYLLSGLITLVPKESIPARIARDPSYIVQLIGISEKPDTSARHISAILQLLTSLLHQTKTEKLILSRITESYFDKMFAPLLNNGRTDMPLNAMAPEEIEKYTYCLLLLINFAGVAKKAYFDKCCTLLQFPTIQNALARAMIGGSENVCSAVFQISQFERFPQANVAKQISKLTKYKSVDGTAASTNTDGDQWQKLNIIMKSHKTFVGKEMEERLSALIDLISNAQRNNQVQNVPMSQIIELFNYKSEMFSCSESCMQRRLEIASEEITNLTQRINLQNAELQKYEMMNFELHVSQEGLQTQCQDLKQQKDNLKHNLASLMKKLSEQSESLQISEKRLTVKVSEVIVLQKENGELKEGLATKTKELEKMHANVKENSTRIEKLKKTIAAFELDIKEKSRIIEERERELNKTHKLYEEQKEAKKKSDDVISVLETQIQDKNEQIRNYELELSETEELRKTIMSLMESKKPKRKT